MAQDNLDPWNYLIILLFFFAYLFYVLGFVLRLFCFYSICSEYNDIYYQNINKQTNKKKKK